VWGPGLIGSCRCGGRLARGGGWSGRSACPAGGTGRWAGSPTTGGDRGEAWAETFVSGGRFLQSTAVLKIRRFTISKKKGNKQNIEPIDACLMVQNSYLNVKSHIGMARNPSNLACPSPQTNCGKGTWGEARDTYHFHSFSTSHGRRARDTFRRAKSLPPSGPKSTASRRTIQRRNMLAFLHAEVRGSPRNGAMG